MGTTAAQPLIRRTLDRSFTFIVDPKKTVPELLQACAFSHQVIPDPKLLEELPAPSRYRVVQVDAVEVVSATTAELVAQVPNRVDPNTALHLLSRYQDTGGTLFTVWKNQDGDYGCLSRTEREGRREFLFSPSTPTAPWRGEKLMVFA
jgi:hypothetical protein